MYIGSQGSAFLKAYILNLIQIIQNCHSVPDTESSDFKTLDTDFRRYDDDDLQANPLQSSAK